MKSYQARFLLTVMLLVCLLDGCKKSSSSPIEALIKERIDKKYNVGIVVAVVEPNATQFYSCGKVSKTDDAAAVNEKTVFPIASITKVFTTLLLADDIVQGLARLNDPANNFLPNSAKLPNYEGFEITLEDLATHTSGLPSFGKVESYTEKELYQTLHQAKLSVAPGSHYTYSDIIGLLGDIVANLSHTPYEVLLQEKILQPLLMQNTALVPFPKQQEVVGYNAADVAGLPFSFPVLQATGALQSTAEDLAKFISANMGLTKTSLYPAMQLSHQPIHSEGAPLEDFDFPGLEKLEIGLGWNIDQEHNVVWKNGNFPNYTSFIGFNPKTKRGVVVLANTGNIAYTDNLALHLLNPEIELLPLYEEVDLPKKTIDAYAGRYQVSDGAYYLFESGKNHLKAQHITTTATSDFFNIYPLSDHQFFGRVADALFSFSEENGVMALVLQEGRKKYSGIRIP